MVWTTLQRSELNAGLSGYRSGTGPSMIMNTPLHDSQCVVIDDARHMMSMTHGNDQKRQRYTFICAHSENDHITGPGRYLPIQSLHDMTFSDRAEGAMLQRFADEHSNQSFGLYVGEYDTGEIHATEYDQDIL